MISKQKEVKSSISISLSIEEKEFIKKNFGSHLESGRGISSYARRVLLGKDLSILQKLELENELLKNKCSKLEKDVISEKELIKKYSKAKRELNRLYLRKLIKSEKSRNDESSGNTFKLLIEGEDDRGISGNHLRRAILQFALENNWRIDSLQIVKLPDNYFKKYAEYREESEKLRKDIRDNAYETSCLKKELHRIEYLKQKILENIQNCNPNSPFELPFYLELCFDYPDLIVNFNDGYKKVDFYHPNSNLVIELDGKQHLEEVQRGTDDIRDSFNLENGKLTLRWSSWNLTKKWDYCVYRTKQIINKYIKNELSIS